MNAQFLFYKITDWSFKVLFPTRNLILVICYGYCNVRICMSSENGKIDDSQMKFTNNNILCVPVYIHSVLRLYNALFHKKIWTTVPATREIEIYYFALRYYSEEPSVQSESSESNSEQSESSEASDDSPKRSKSRKGSNKLDEKTRKVVIFYVDLIQKQIIFARF